jgi:diguanylate cyclase (GGDEF)-like protein
MDTSENKTNRDCSAVEELRAANRTLSSHVEALELRNQELQRIRGLVTLLQLCLTIEELYAVVARTVPKLFRTESGAVYLFSSRLQTLEPVATWGDNAPDANVSVNMAGWSLVQERSYYDDEKCFHVLCPDGKQSGKDNRICVMIVGRHETLGLLYVQLNENQTEMNEEERQRMIRSKRQLAVTTAETIALYFTNVKLRESLYEQAIHDPLTGLLNRRLLHELLEKEIQRAARKKLPLGVIMADIDHFKTINDTYGHGAGDEVLRECGLFLKKRIRGWDFACRYGGDEFLLVLTEASLDHVRQRAEQFCKEAKLLEIHYRGRLLDPITLSMGVAVHPEHGPTAQEMLYAADAALYQAKADGRDRIATVRRHAIERHMQHD